MAGPDFDAYLTDQDRYQGYYTEPDAGFGGQDITYDVPDECEGAPETPLSYAERCSRAIQQFDCPFCGRKRGRRCIRIRDDIYSEPIEMTGAHEPRLRLLDDEGGPVANAASITDPDIRRIFEAGEKNGTLRFMYATQPAATKYFVFQQLVDGVWLDKKMTWTEIIGELGRG